MYEKLLDESPYDNLTGVLLQQLFTSWLSLLIKAASDHLQGGKYAVLTDATKQETKSVPRHNKFPERIFAFLDALTRFLPVASTLCNEAYIMFTLNKTGKWLNSLPEDERARHLEAARSGGRELRQKYKERSKDIQRTLRENLHKKRQLLEKKAQKGIR